MARTVIQASRGWARLRVGQLWAFRELLAFLVWRDIKVRYKQTVLGVGWAVAQPLLTVIVFSLFFGRLARVPSDGLPYPLFACAALVPWVLFANGLQNCSESLVANSQLITKVYFPRLIIPVAAVGATLVDFLIGLVLLIGVSGAYGALPGLRILWAPMFMLLALATALGVGLWLSTLNLRFRDVRYLVPFLIQLWLFASPVAYPSSLLPPSWRVVYSLNPMVGVVEGFRWSLAGAPTPPGAMVAISALVTLALLGSGAVYFRRMERTFADIA